MLEQVPGRTCGHLEREELMVEQVCWQNMRPCVQPMLEQPVLEGLHPVEGTHAGEVCDELQPVGRTRFGAACGEWSPMRGTSYWSRGRV